MHKEHPDLHILHLSKSIGKKGAIEMATQIAKGEIYFFMDSDCNMANDAVENAVRSSYQIDNWRRNRGW